MTTKVGLMDWEFFSENLFSTKNYQAKKRERGNRLFQKSYN